MTLTRETRQQLAFVAHDDGLIGIHTVKRTTLHWPTGTLARELAEVSTVECEGCDRAVRVHGWDGEWDARHGRIGTEIIEGGAPDASYVAWRVTWCQRCRDAGSIEGTMWCEGCNRQLENADFVIYDGDYACQWCHNEATLNGGTPELDEKYTTVEELNAWALDNEPSRTQWRLAGVRLADDDAVTLAAKLQARWGKLLVCHGQRTRAGRHWDFYREA